MVENKYKDIFQNVSILAKNVQIVLLRLTKYQKKKKFNIQTNRTEN